MKPFKGKPNRTSGFTLMELLVVVSIMVILAGLTMGVMTFVNQKQAIEQAKVQLGLLELALEDYYSENGEYPSNYRDDGKNGSDDIQRALFPSSTASKVYLAELDPDNDTQGWLSGSGNNYKILKEDLGKAKAASTDLLGILVTDQRKALLTDFRKKDFPRLLLDLFGIELDA